MAKRIQGITIEIGGDTVGLQKALSDVNKRSKDLQSELRDVERLLKFNPGNVEALAQKQALLTKQIENTTDKLNQLKAAEQQVQAQFKKGDISEEQYRAFRREIEFTEGSLNGLKNKLADMQAEQDRTTNSTRQLNTLFEATGTSVDDYANSLGNRLVRAIKDGTASSKQLDDAISKIGKEALGSSVDIDKMKQALSSIDDGASLKSVRKDLSNVAKEAKEAGDEVNGFGIELENVVAGLAVGGGIAGVVSQALDTSSLNTQIDITFNVPEESKQSVKEAVKSVEAYGIDAEAALEGVRRQWALNKDASDESNRAVIDGAATIAKAYAGIDFTELIQETNEISRELNISNEEALGLTNSLLKVGFPPEQLDIIAEYGKQLTEAGYSAEEVQAIMAAGVETGTWNIDNLLDGLKEGRIKLAEFGQEVPKATKELLDGTEISTKQLQEWGKAVAQGGQGGKKAMQEVAEALMNVEDETQRNALGVELFGTMWEDQGTNITDTLLNMDNHLMSAKENQDALNQSTEQLNADPAVKMQQALADLKMAFAPLLAAIAEMVAKLALWASENPKLTATIVGIGTAIGILIGAFATLTPAIVSITGAIGGASGAAALFGTALAVLTGPIGLTIAALAGLTAGGIALYNHLKESSIEVDLWGDEVSEATQKAVGGFLDLNDQATVALNQLAWSGQTVTGEMANNIISTFDQMGQQILTNMQEDHAVQLETMQTFFDTSAALTEVEEAEIIAKMQENQLQQQQTVTDGQARIAEILNTAKEEKRAITDAERQEINAIQEQMVTQAVEYMSENEREQKVILERLKTESTKITAEQAAEVVKNSIKQKEEVVKEANDQYNKTIAEIIKQRDETGTISAEQADKLIKEATRQRDETVKNAEDMHEKVVREAKAQATEHVDQVNWQTGEVKSKWQVMKDDISKKASQIKTDVSKKWEEIKTDTSKKWEEIKSWPGKKLAEMKTDVSTKLQEIRNKFSEKIEEIKGFFTNLKLKIPTPSLPKLPRFSLTTSSREIMGKTITYPTGFDVNWYDKGGIFYGPSIIGVGEKRPEFVGALDDLKAIVKSAMGEMIRGQEFIPQQNTTTQQNHSFVINPAPIILDGIEIGRVDFDLIEDELSTRFNTKMFINGVNR